MGSKAYSNAKLFAAAVVVAVLAACLACAPHAWAKTGSINAVTTVGTFAAGTTPTQKVATSTYAIVKNDGYLHATTRSHTSDEGYLWGSDYSSCKQALDAVTTLYIDSNVTSLKDVKVQYLSGKKPVDKSITLSGNTGRPGTHNVKLITFVKNASNSNSCSVMDDWYQFANLKSLEMVSNFQYTQMTTVPNGCFYKCSNLGYVALPAKATTIGSSAFFDCDRLPSVVVPAAVTSIGQGPTDGVFANCDGLKRVTLESTSRISITSNSFLRTPADLKFYVPNAVVSRYQEQANSNPWKKAGLTSQVHPFLEVADIPAATYTGSAIKPAIKATWLGDQVLSENQYTVSYTNNVNAGTAKVTVSAKSPYAGTVVKTFAIVGQESAADGGQGYSGIGDDDCLCTILPATDGGVIKSDQHLSAKGKKVAVKAGKSVKASKAIALSSAKGKITYAKASGKGKIKVATNGKITVKKGCKRGTYTIGVRVTASGDSSHNGASATVSVVVKVK